MDIYFITNQSDDDIEIDPIFRVNKNLKPQLWDAETGEVRQLNDFQQTENGTAVPIKMKAAQSWFVVFTNVSDAEVKKGTKQIFPNPNFLKPSRAVIPSISKIRQSAMSSLLFLSNLPTGQNQPTKNKILLRNSGLQYNFQC